jgi:hypothetical protein
VKSRGPEAKIPALFFFPFETTLAYTKGQFLLQDRKSTQRSRATTFPEKMGSMSRSQPNVSARLLAFRKTVRPTLKRGKE